MRIVARALSKEVDANHPVTAGYTFQFAYLLSLPENKLGDGFTSLSCPVFALSKNQVCTCPTQRQFYVFYPAAILHRVVFAEMYGGCRL